MTTTDQATELKNWGEEHKSLFEVLEIIGRRKELYRKQNRQISDLMGDFPTNLQAMDDKIESAIVKYLDEQIESICKLSEMASYYLYECDKGGMVSCKKANKDFEIKTIDDLKKRIFFFSHTN